MGRTGLIGDNSVEFVRKLIQIWNVGDCAVLVDWRIPKEAAAEMLRETNVTKCYISDKIADGINRNQNIDGVEFIEYEDCRIKCEYVPDEIYEIYQDNYSTDEAVILYSSGTTGKAKGIILSHYAINTNADMILDYMNLSKDGCLYIVKALAHSSTLVGELLTGLKRHIRMLLSPTICLPGNILQTINKYEITTMCVNPSLLNLYVKAASIRKMNYHSLKTMYTSGAIIETSLLEKAQEAFGYTQILNVYGLSEAGPRVTAQRAGERNRTGSVGKVIKNVDVAIVSEDGTVLPAGEKGIIHVNTPCMFSGYVSGNRMRKSYYQDWFNTGDIGYTDEEYNLYITGRIDNMVTVDSHNVYPEELELFIKKIQGVTDCSIVSQKSSIHGNQLICYYVSDYDMSVKLHEYCVSGLASYEMPSAFCRIRELPVTNNGKKIRDLHRYQ